MKSCTEELKPLTSNWKKYAIKLQNGCDEMKTEWETKGDSEEIERARSGEQLHRKTGPEMDTRQSAVDVFAGGLM